MSPLALLLLLLSIGFTAAAAAAISDTAEHVIRKIKPTKEGTPK